MNKMKVPAFRGVWLSLVMCMFHLGAYAQYKPLTLQDCIEIALQQNLRIKGDSLRIAQDDVLRKTAFDPEKTRLSLLQDPTDGGNGDNALEITQSFDWPGVYIRKKRTLEQQFLLTKKAKAITASEVIREVKLNFYNYLYQTEKLKLLEYLDSIYTEFSIKAARRAETGETGRLEVLAAQNTREENRLLEKQALSDRRQYMLALQELLNTQEAINLIADSLMVIPWVATVDSLNESGNPVLDFYRQRTQLANSRVRLEKSRLWPDLTIGYSHQFLVEGFNPAHIERKYFPGTRIGGFQVGVGLPLFAGSFAAQIKAEKIAAAVADNQLTEKRRRMQTEWQQALATHQQYVRSLNYYRSSGLKLAEEQLRVAQLSFARGEIGYVGFIQNISQATRTKLNYLSVLNHLNETIIHLQYLQGNLQ